MLLLTEVVLPWDNMTINTTYIVQTPYFEYRICYMTTMWLVEVVPKVQLLKRTASILWKVIRVISAARELAHGCPPNPNRAARWQAVQKILEFRFEIL